MNRLSLYLLRHLLVAMLFVTAGLTLIIWLTQALRLLEVVVDGGAPVGLFLKLMLVTLPTFLAVVLPITLLAAILFTYNRLTMDSELLVMRAAGVGPVALGRPALLLGIAVTLACYALTLEVAPWANRELVRMERLARSSYSTVFLREGVFNDVGDGLTIYIRRRRPDGELEGLLIHDTRVPEKPATVMAERGATVEGDAGTRVVVYNGHRQEVDLATGRMSRLLFDRYAVDLQVFEPEFASRVPDPRERSVGELLDARDDPGALGMEASRLSSELHQRLTQPLAGIGFAVIALAAMLTGEFNRRGQSRKVLGAVLAVVLLQSAGLGAANVAANRPGMVPLLYVVALLPTLAGGWMLLRGGTLRTPLRRQAGRPAGAAP